MSGRKRTAMSWIAASSFAFTCVLASFQSLSTQVAAEEQTPASSTSSYSVEDIVMLKNLGFNENELKQELEPQRGLIEFDGSEISQLQQAGFSDDFIAFIQTLAPERVLDNAAIEQMLKTGATPLEVLSEMATATGNYD